MYLSIKCNNKRLSSTVASIINTPSYAVPISTTQSPLTYLFT